jgi:GTPase SAR1 family protein
VCSSSAQTPEAKAAAAAAREEQAGAKALNRNIALNKKRDANVHKLLLLGAGESGKSTLFKQMIMMYGEVSQREMSRDALISYKEFVFSNMMGNAHSLSVNSHEFGPPQTEEGTAARDFFESEGWDSEEHTEYLKEEVVTHLANLWNDPGIQITYSLRNNFQLNDTTEYFFTKLHEIAQPDYVPNVGDFLRVRIRTTGIVEHNFTVDGVHFQMFDVGGQRNERKKWLHCFDSVQAVLFVASLSEFDQFLYEEHTTNRMTEAFQLFEEMSNLEVFAKSSIILFLNKIDLFTEKVKTKNISESDCPELQQIKSQQPPINERDAKDTALFIQRQFLRKFRGSPSRIHPHITCATDTTTVQKVFNSVKATIINNALSGLMDM